MITYNTYIHTYIHVHEIRKCIIYTHACTFTYCIACIHTYIRTYALKCISYMHAIRTYIHTCTYIHTYIQKHHTWTVHAYTYIQYICPSMLHHAYDTVTSRRYIHTYIHVAYILAIHMVNVYTCIHWYKSTDTFLSHSKFLTCFIIRFGK